MTSVTSDRRSNHTIVSETPEQIDTVVIGAGQAGLASGYHLAQQGVRFVILEQENRVGDVWRNRWDTLQLFTPARFDSLPGMPFPANQRSFPTKDEMGDYLETYAATMNLPVRTGMNVHRVARTSSGAYLVSVDKDQIVAQHVVIAAGAYQVPKVPDFAFDLDPAIVQVHSHDYRNPSQFTPGPVLVVGASNSGAEIAIEAARYHHTILSGSDPGQIPFRLESTTAKLAIPVLWTVWNRILTVDTPMGRKAKNKIRNHGGPLVRIKRSDIAQAGVEWVHAKTSGARDGKPMLEDKRILDVANVVWCTGFRREYSWIDGLSYGDDGYPTEDHGIVTGSPGLYFVGLKFQRSFASMLVGGVGRDAAHIANQIATAVGQAA